jgi:hypothetical protein
MADVSEYEVRCPRCDVSFPIDTRKCMHCGGPTGPSHGPRGRIKLEERSAAHARGDPKSVQPFDPAEVFRAEPVGAEPEDAEPTRRGGLLRGIATLIWIAVAIGISVAKSCSDGG